MTDAPTKFMAIGKGNVTGPAANTPRDAALAFFDRYPNRRLCSVVEGSIDGPRWLTVPRKHRYWRDITRKQINEMLPADAA
jgi:hypothetical protein